MKVTVSLPRRISRIGETYFTHILPIMAYLNLIRIGYSHDIFLSDSHRLCNKHSRLKMHQIVSVQYVKATVSLLALSEF